MSTKGKMAAFEILYFNVVVCMRRKEEDSSLVGNDIYSTPSVPIKKRMKRQKRGYMPCMLQASE